MAAPKSGPTAKQRPDDRLGHRTKAEQGNVTTITVPQEADPPIIPGPSPAWTQTAKDAWTAFTTSPARQYWESTDYVTAHFLCDLITSCQTSGYRAGQVQMIRQLMVDLLFTETARRAADLQITRTPEQVDPAKVSAMEYARNRRA